MYDGGTLSRKGVVVVTLNYRLGALGFLAHPDLTTESPHHSSGNYGFLDQAAALGWVKRNIGAFGGDPSRVTAFGESAGANSMLAHLVSPGSKGLLQQAIVESGPLWSDGGTIAVFLPRAWAEQDGVSFAASLGVSGPDTIRGLRATKVADLLAASPSDQGSVFWFMHALRFKPITDGWVIPEDPRILFRRGVATIPLLIGTNADEGTTLAVNAEMSVADYPQFVRDTFGPKAGQVLARYPASTPEEVQHQMERMMTDIDFAAAAKFVAGSSPDSWLYRFSYVTPGFGLGAFHGSELLYIFRSGLMPSDPTSTGVSDTMMDLWTRFARTGDPNGGIGVTWPRYETSADRYLDIGASPTVKSGYGPAPTACKADAKTMCLGPDGRFKVQATYGDYAGNRGDGKARKLSNASGYFSFYDPENIELVVKFLGFCSGGSGDWAFYASGLTDLEFTLDVTDTRTGIHREYLNPLGSRFCTAVDESFPCP